MLKYRQFYIWHEGANGLVVVRSAVASVMYVVRTCTRNFLGKGPKKSYLYELKFHQCYF